MTRIFAPRCDPSRLYHGRAQEFDITMNFWCLRTAAAQGGSYVSICHMTFLLRHVMDAILATEEATRTASVCANDYRGRKTQGLYVLTVQTPPRHRPGTRCGPEIRLIFHHSTRATVAFAGDIFHDQYQSCPKLEFCIL